MTTRKPGDEWGRRHGRLSAATTPTRAASTRAGRSPERQRWRSRRTPARRTASRNNVTIDCNDCVDYFEENGVTARLLFDAAAVSSTSRPSTRRSTPARSISTRRSRCRAAAFLGNPAFYEDPNDHQFRYINNVNPTNEQENLNLSLKGDWDIGFATLTAYVAHNQQDELLPDGRHQRGLQPVCADPTGTCQARIDAHRDPGSTAVLRRAVRLWFYA